MGVQDQLTKNNTPFERTTALDPPRSVIATVFSAVIFTPAAAVFIAPDAPFSALASFGSTISAGSAASPSPPLPLLPQPAPGGV
ncbi:hypothetical protein BDQ12DRAFT_694026 [Crucibulum laeve]|uniref:Uncharacterized protein n=1 Tax=Crucibulum laeve TaxID=68775 RepID=A0A5C3LEG3_9AGAR|nr:hypothetical protein BDQ12DRAFT_694026 [Crucibulum laeve]